MKPSPRWYPLALADGRRAGVRDARPSDAKAALAGVTEVVKERPRTLLVSEGELWTPRQWRERRLAWTPDGAWLAAELDGAFAGMYAIQRGSRRAERHTAEFGIWLVRAARGLGLGRLLIEVGEIWAREHGVRRVELSVFVHNTRARALYHACGYALEGVRRNAYVLPEGDAIDAVTMAKLL